MQQVLPSQTSLLPFIGREPEITEITRLLAQSGCRLLTVVGLGGIGKTRLALEVMARLRVHYTDGVCFVSFVESDSINDGFSFLAEAFNLPAYEKLSTRDQVVAYLNSKQLLLVLDNLEGLLGSIGWISELLAAVPHLKIVATSREALNLREEWLYPLWGLDFPAHADQTAEHMRDYSAMRLFAQCTQRADKDFVLERDYPHVVHICQMVGGLPLAIELTAAWLKTLSCAEVAQELEKHTVLADTLQSQVRNFPERHRSMSIVLGHTWTGLTDEERACLERLSVFRSNFTWEAAQATTDATLPVIASLIDKALVRKSAQYSLHELIRQYAAWHLSPDELQATRDRQCRYYLKFLAAQTTAFKGAAQIAAMDAVEGAFENICGAWEWAVDQKTVALLVEAVEGLTLFCTMRGHATIGESLLRRAVEALTTTSDNAESAASRILQARWLFILEWYELYRDRPILKLHMQRLLVEARDSRDRAEIAFALKNCGHYAIQQEEFAAAQAYFEESLALYANLEDEYAIAQVQRLIGHSYAFAGHSERGLVWYERSRELALQMGDRMTLAVALMGMGSVSAELGHKTNAIAYFQQAYQIQYELGNWSRLAFTAYNLAYLMLEQGDFTTAKAYATEALDIAINTGYIAHEQRTRQALLHIDAASAVSSIESTSLSARELEVLRLMAAGLQNREIAEQLVVVVGTVKTHVHSIYRKLDVTNRVQAVSRAHQLKILQE